MPSTIQIRALVRRLASIAALVAIDVGGIAWSLYLALVTRDVWRLAGVRRRAILLGSAERLVDLRRALGLGRGGIDYEFLGAVVADGGHVEMPLLGSVPDLPGILDRLHPDELIVSGIDLGDEAFLDLVEHAHRAGVKVRIAPTTTELLTQRSLHAPVLDRRVAAGAERAPRRDVARRPAPAAAARLRAARRLAPEALPRAAGDDRPLAGLGPHRAELRRSRAARLLLPRELVDLARYLDPREDAARGSAPARSVLNTGRRRSHRPRAIRRPRPA